MKRATRWLLLGSIWSILAASAAAAVQPTNSPAPALGYSLYKRLPLSGQIAGIVQMRCSTGGCDTVRTTEELAGASGAVDVWEDSRITPTMRSQRWGRGGKIVFEGQPANPAIIALHDAAGAIVATLALEQPLVDLDPLLTGAAVPTYLLSVDYPVGGSFGGTALIARAVLDLDVDKHQIALATFEGPIKVPTLLPTGQTVDTSVPGATQSVTFDTNFEIDTNAVDHTARIAVISCTPSSYVDYWTRLSVRMNLTARTQYDLQGDVWRRRAQLDFHNCGDTGLLGAPIHISSPSISPFSPFAQGIQP